VSGAPVRARARREPPRRRRVLVPALAALVAFVLGIALGQALEDNPRPASTITNERTSTVPPESATVTVTAP
jgi:hypothetical protein